MASMTILRYFHEGGILDHLFVKTKGGFISEAVGLVNNHSTKDLRHF